MTTIVSEHPIANYSTATQLASVYQASSRRIVELTRELAEEVSVLNAAFKGSEAHKQFSCVTTICGADKEKQIARELKRTAWRTLIEKLGMRQLLSTKKLEELDEALNSSKSGRYFDGEYIDKIDEMPDISGESIMEILGGYAASASEFLTEKIHEVYEYLKPWRGDDYKTNEKNRWKLSEKLIKSYAVESSSYTGFRVSYGRTGDMLQSLDIIMHLLDGKGIPTSHYGPLISSINGSKEKTGETEYFKWKAFHNRNLHLVFKRRDLVDEFNFICGHERELPGQAKGGTYDRASKQYDNSVVEAGANGEYDLFETPEALAEQMCELAGIKAGSEVLEPSAGKGRIVRAAKSLGAIVTAIEVQTDLPTDGCVVYNADFLNMNVVMGPFDAVVMNPPFSNGQDAKHIRHAFTFLKSGGTLVAIASAGVTFRKDKSTEEFRRWLGTVDATITALPAGTFKESGTGVNTVLIVIGKP